MELKRSIRNKSYLYCVIVVLLSFVFGYILLVSIDKVEQVTLSLLSNSVYTVFTQFGTVIFPIVTIYVFNIDYKEKNILFYKLLKQSSITYYFNKLCVIMMWFTVAIIGCSVLVSIIYQDFSKIFAMIFYYEQVVIYQTLIASILAFLIPNILGVFCVNLFCWIASLVLATTTKHFEFLAYFDASSSLYQELDRYWKTGNVQYLHIGKTFIHNGVLFALVLIILIIFKKRWEKNGI